jgi:predicted nucleotidyltransferase
MPSPPPSRGVRGQAGVEFVALLPLIVLLALLAWQAVVFGQAVWLSGAAARAAARAAAIGRDPAVAARSVLPVSLARGVDVRAEGDGAVVLRLAVPAVVVDVDLASVRTRARFAAQETG